jgi:hypothetical protein
MTLFNLLPASKPDTTVRKTAETCQEHFKVQTAENLWLRSTPAIQPYGPQAVSQFHQDINNRGLTLTGRKYSWIQWRVEPFAPPTTIFLVYSFFPCLQPSKSPAVLSSGRVEAFVTKWPLFDLLFFPSCGSHPRTYIKAKLGS